jgi:bifunctional DNA-binding transcriptional regulator/antitoxin component of YhaV-PrlF toxin-antitoxin module
MSHVVGTKGQIVIEKGIRDRLGVEPGWVALQRLVDDHVEIYLIPPAHRKSLKGSLSRYTSVSVAQGDEWDKARESAWAQAVREETDSGEGDS